MKMFIFEQEKLHIASATFKWVNQRQYIYCQICVLFCLINICATIKNILSHSMLRIICESISKLQFPVLILQIMEKVQGGKYPSMVLYRCRSDASVCQMDFGLSEVNIRERCTSGR